MSLLSYSIILNDNASLLKKKKFDFLKTLYWPKLQLSGLELSSFKKYVKTA